MNPHYPIKKLREFRERRRKYVARIKLADIDPMTLHLFDLTERSLFDAALRSIELHRDEYAYYNQLAKDGMAYIWTRMKDKATSKKWIFAPKPFDLKGFFKQAMP